MAFSTPQSRRHSKTSISGIVIGAVDANIYKVRFQNGKDIECNLCKLKVIPNEDIPPSLHPLNSIKMIMILILKASPKMLLLLGTKMMMMMM